MKYKKRKSYYYYRKQRYLGVALVVLGVLSAIILGDGTAALLIVPLGLYVACTKERILLDDYFYEMEEKNLNEDRP